MEERSEINSIEYIKAIQRLKISSGLENTYADLMHSRWGDGHQNIHTIYDDERIFLDDWLRDLDNIRHIKIAVANVRATTSSLESSKAISIEADKSLVSTSLSVIRHKFILKIIFNFSRRPDLAEFNKVKSEAETLLKRQKAAIETDLGRRIAKSLKGPIRLSISLLVVYGAALAAGITFILLIAANACTFGVDIQDLQGRLFLGVPFASVTFLITTLFLRQKMIYYSLLYRKSVANSLATFLENESILPVDGDQEARKRLIYKTFDSFLSLSGENSAPDSPPLSMDEIERIASIIRGKGLGG